MAVIENWTEEQQRAWDEWVRDRPKSVRKLAKRFPPSKLYRMSSTGHRVTIKGYGEDGTLIVAVTGTYNAVMFNRQVHGVEPSKLEECELPKPGEVLGCVLNTQQEVDRYVAKLKAQELREARRATKH